MQIKVFNSKFQFGSVYCKLRSSTVFSENFSTTALSMSNCYSSLQLFVQNQQWKDQNNVWNLLKIKNKDTRATTLTSFCCFYCKLWEDLALFWCFLCWLWTRKFQLRSCQNLVKTKNNVTNEMASYFSECSETKLHLMILSQTFFNFTFLGYLRKRLGQKSYYMKFLTDYYSYTLYIL